MAFELPKLPFPTDANGVPYIASPDTAGNYAAVSGTHVKNASGLWVPVSDTDPMPTKVTGSNLSQVLITETLDFKGKTAGRTFDVPHVAKHKAGGGFFAPDTFSSELSSDAYTKLSSTDGSSNALSTGSDVNYAQHLFSINLLTALKIAGRIPQSWTVDQLKAALKSLTVTWVGYGVGADAGAPKNGATLKRWRADSSTWAVSRDSTASSPAVLVAEYDAATAATGIDANGFLHILAHSTYPSDGTNPSTIYTDYVKVDVTLEVPALLVSDPLTYDPVNRATRTVAVNRNKTVVDTVVNAASVAAGGNLEFDMGVTDESEIWVLVNIDKQPWRLFTSTVASTDTTATGYGAYPNRNAAQTSVFTSGAKPAASLLLGMAPYASFGLTEPASIQEARQYQVPPPPGSRGRIYNDSAETTTVTIRIVRVWR